MTRRLTASQVKAHRDKLLEEQGGRCALCGELIQRDDVLDHDHKTGEIRGVLHRGCNAMLGHLENNRARHLLTSEVRFARFLSNVQKYLLQRRDDPVLYPTHRTDEEKRELRLKRAREARAKARKAKP